MLCGADPRTAILRMLGGYALALGRPVRRRLVSLAQSTLAGPRLAHGHVAHARGVLVRALGGLPELRTPGGFGTFDWLSAMFAQMSLLCADLHLCPFLIGVHLSAHRCSIHSQFVSLCFRVTCVAVPSSAGPAGVSSCRCTARTRCHSWTFPWILCVLLL